MGIKKLEMRDEKLHGAINWEKQEIARGGLFGSKEIGPK